MENYGTYIFDLDGTLLDTLDGLAFSVNYALEHHGMPKRSIDEVRSFVGNGVAKLIERAVAEGTDNAVTEQVLQTFRHHYSNHSVATSYPYDGVLEMLKRLKSEGKRTAVVSNKFHSATVGLCDKFFGTLIDIAVGEGEGIRRKPHPDGIIKVMKNLGACLDDCVYVGDSDVDIETARRAGMPCISVLWGFRDKAFLASHGASIFAETPSDIF